MSALGFLMLDTHFPRIVGDAGCADTWDFPVIYHTIRGGTAARVVREQSTQLLPALIDSGKQLAAQGVIGLSTTCGFLCLYQQALAAALPLPIMTSALLSAPQLIAALPADKKLGILSVSATQLSDNYLTAAAINKTRVVVGGLAPASYFATTLLNDHKTLDTQQAYADMLHAAQELIAQDSSITALLFECTNMPPYKDAVQQATGLPVYSIVDAVNAFYARLNKTI